MLNSHQLQCSYKYIGILQAQFEILLFETISSRINRSEQKYWTNKKNTVQTKWCRKKGSEQSTINLSLSYLFTQGEQMEAIRPDAPLPDDSKQTETTNNRTHLPLQLPSRSKMWPLPKLQIKGLWTLQVL